MLSPCISESALPPAKKRWHKLCLSTDALLLRFFLIIQIFLLEEDEKIIFFAFSELAAFWRAHVPFT
jgi:hypothetical protein